MLRFSPLARLASRPAPLVRWYATKRGGDVDEAELEAARAWLSKLDPDTIPKEICEVTFSRSSGPGGQNVNKVSSKATLRVSMSQLLQRIPRIMHAPIQSSRYHAAKSDAVVIQADDSRKQSDNVKECYKKLQDMIVQAGREAVPNETGAGQMERVEKLEKAEAAKRRKMKEFQSKKKTARRGGGGRGDD